MSREVDLPEHLGELLERAASRWHDRPAVEDEKGLVWTYAELRRNAECLASWLVAQGIGRADRVGLFLPKCLEGVAAIHATLRAGASYVPTDPTGPPARAAGILLDAGVKAIVVVEELVGALRSAWQGPLPPLVIVGTLGTHGTAWDAIQAGPDGLSPLPDRSPDDLAYVLYTSGSTGRPKGVMLTHANAGCFLNWCLTTFDLRAGDRFGSHAPFHFDLSVFDLFASCAVGGTVVLVGEALGKEPARLGGFLAERRLDVWYSAPSILALLTEYGGIDAPGFPALRLVLFAGEVFPVRPLRRLRQLWPDAVLWNLYGPTETNVCTAYEVPVGPIEEGCEPLPIGPVCPPLRARVVDESGRDVSPGVEGELWIAGPGVMIGYLGLDEATAAAFRVDDEGTRWYCTGDRVVDDGTGSFTFRGRRDRMVKRRGHRIELGEVECALARHEDVEAAAVVARSDDSGVSIAAFLVPRPGARASQIAMRRACATTLPASMVPDLLVFATSLPRTSTDKVDYQALARSLEERTNQGRS
jgi:amino acid adenylation domain-containing protein